MGDLDLARRVEEALAPLSHYIVHYRMKEQRRACEVPDADPMYGIGWEPQYDPAPRPECPRCRAFVDKFWVKP